MIISAMPGVGKSFYAKKNPEEAIDLDSSSYKLKDGTHDYKKYIKCVEEADKKYEVVFCSSHREMRENLKKSDLNFYFVAYLPEMKENVIKRILKRNTDQNNERIAKVVNGLWDAWLEERAVGNPLGIYELAPGQYIDFIIPVIKFREYEKENNKGKDENK